MLFLVELMGCVISSDNYPSHQGNIRFTGYKYTSTGKIYKTRREKSMNRRGASSTYVPGYKYDSTAKCFKSPNYNIQKRL